MALSAALLLGLGALVGQRAAYSGLGMDPEEYRAMRKALPAAQQRIAELEAEVAAAGTYREVDRTALEILRRDLAQQEEQIAALGERLQFYRGLMAPGEIAQGVSLRSLELVGREQSRRYAYRLVLQQEARKHSTVRGSLRITVQGLRDGKPASYLLSALAEDLAAADIELRFRYFQAVEGELRLPEGFTPRAIEARAMIESPRELTLTDQFPWQLQERFTHVGK